jgi:hypothetical protein
MYPLHEAYRQTFVWKEGIIRSSESIEGEPTSEISLELPTLDFGFLVALGGNPLWLIVNQTIPQFQDHGD